MGDFSSCARVVNRWGCLRNGNGQLDDIGLTHNNYLKKTKQNKPKQKQKQKQKCVTNLYIPRDTIALFILFYLSNYWLNKYIA